MLKEVMIKMAWAGRSLTCLRLPAPKYWDTMDEMALRVCPKTHISIEIKVVTMPTAAKETVALVSIFPIMAASVSDRMGSEIPEMSAGMASLFIFLNEIAWLTR